MNHGTAILKEDLVTDNDEVLIPKGTMGVVTAYLPEMERFAVHFGGSNWITFNDTEPDFLNRVEYTPNKDE